MIIMQRLKPHVTDCSHSVPALSVGLNIRCAKMRYILKWKAPSLKCCKHCDASPLLKQQQKIENTLARRKKSRVLLGILNIFFEKKCIAGQHCLHLKINVFMTVF